MTKLMNTHKLVEKKKKKKKRKTDALAEDAVAPDCGLKRLLFYPKPTPSPESCTVRTP